LPFGGKPFVDDGNRYAALAGVPVLTHGPNARGAHTTEEWVPVDELVRVAQVYALMAVDYCADASL
jgi:acetylornithine deacetylase/succinyl-diaminopimelate desuccinylase-like protein